MQGCTNLDALNYNPSATIDGLNCLYSIPRSGGPAKLFRDYPTLVDQSFTISYSLEGGGWVFFHDYIPDFYFHTRNQLWSLHNREIFKHNSGPKGQYYEDVKPFFIDMVFRSESDMLLECVTWVSELVDKGFDSSVTEGEWNTLTHISIWNSQQHTGRVNLQDVFKDLQYEDKRKTQGEWSFNDFRDVLKQRGPSFLQDIFNNYSVKPGALGDNSWYDRSPLEDKYFVVRFEYDNLADKQLILHKTNIQAIKSER